MNPTNKTLLTALVLSLFSLATIQGIKIINNPSSSQNVLGEVSVGVQGIPCSVINNWQQQYCASNVGPSNPPQPTSQPVCKTGVNSSSYGPSCSVPPSSLAGNYYLKYVCYDGYSGVVGDTNQKTCTKQSDLSLKAQNACASHSNCPVNPTPIIGQTNPPQVTPRIATPTPPPTKVTPTPISVGVSGLKMVSSCNPNGTINFTVSGYLSPGASYLSGVHYLVMNNSTSKVYHQGWQTGGKTPIEVAVSSAGYLMDTLNNMTEPTYSQNNYTIHFVDAAYSSTVNWSSPFIGSFFIPSTNCPIVTTPTPHL